MHIDVSRDTSARLVIQKKMPEHYAIMQALYKTKVFSNDARGFAELQAWLRKQGGGTAHVCMEETGAYHEALALFLVEAGYAVSVTNPAQIKALRKACSRAPRPTGSQS